jgi:predicted  nucleic acid-binding Zn-ribbon protein
MWIYITVGLCILLSLTTLVLFIRLRTSHTQNISLTSQIADLTSQIQTLTQAGTTAQSTYDSLHSQYMKLQTQATDQLNQDKQQQVVLQNKIVSLQAQLSAAPTIDQINTLNNTISSLQKQLAAAPTQTQVNSLNTQIASLQSQLSNAPTASMVSGLQNQIVSLQTQLASRVANSNALTASLSAAQAALTAYGALGWILVGSGDLPGWGDMGTATATSMNSCASIAAQNGADMFVWGGANWMRPNTCYLKKSQQHGINTGFTTAVPMANGKWWNNMPYDINKFDLTDNNITNPILNIPESQCQAACAANSNCNMYTYNPSSQICHMKTLPPTANLQVGAIQYSSNGTLYKSDQSN